MGKSESDFLFFEFVFLSRFSNGEKMSVRVLTGNLNSLKYPDSSLSKNRTWQKKKMMKKFNQKFFCSKKLKKIFSEKMLERSQEIENESRCAF